MNIPAAVAAAIRQSFLCSVIAVANSCKEQWIELHV